MSEEIKAFARRIDLLYGGSHAEDVEEMASELVSQVLERAREIVDARSDELQAEAVECGCYRKLWAAASDIKKIAESLVQS